MNNPLPHIVDLGQIGSSALGYITVAEPPANVPFDIKRVYWTYYTPHNVVRGEHAHKQLQQIIVAVNGIIEFELIGKDYHQTFKLTKPNEGLYIPKQYWRNITFSHSAVLLCLASMEYSEDDYIRNYDDFLAIIS